MQAFYRRIAHKILEELQSERHERMELLNALSNQLAALDDHSVLTFDEAGMGYLSYAQRNSLFLEALLYNVKECYFPTVGSGNQLMPSASSKRINDIITELPFETIVESYTYTQLYNPNPQLHLRVLRTLIANGCDLSVALEVCTCISCLTNLEVLYFRDSILLVLLFGKHENDEITELELLIGEHNLTDKLCPSWISLCFGEAIKTLNIKGIQLLLDHGNCLQAGTVERCMDAWTKIERVGIYLDIITGNHIYDLQHDLRDWSARRIPLSAFLEVTWPFSFADGPDEQGMDFWLAKGHLAPTPLSINRALRQHRILHVLQIVKLCMRRGIRVEYPDMAYYDISDVGEVTTDERDYFAQLAHFISSTQSPCPPSFLPFLQTVAYAKALPHYVPTLCHLSVLAVRRYWLEPDADEQLPASLVVLKKKPFSPRMVIIKKVAALLPEFLARKVLFFETC